MKRKFLIALFPIALLTFIAISQIKSKPFAPAEDLPRGALVYVQFADLPAFFKIWNESNLKKKYETSRNYSDFYDSHLGLKIFSRWDEFDAAAGFDLDLETVAKMANNQAAIAVYDIGKLEFVFAAPVSDEVFAATQFFQNKDKFTEETLPDGTTIYRAAVEADRGRQKQELIFTNAKGRFVLATSEKLLMQTLNNINGGKTKNRLSDEPDFKALIEKTTTHAATVWINQTALNDDYYFKHYWLMSDADELKNIRAGIFDLEISEEKLIEKRRFLLKENVSVEPLGKAQASAMLDFLPENIPFYKLEKPRAQTLGAAIERTISEKQNVDEATEQFFSGASDGYTSGDYEYMGDQFDETIDETEDETIQKSAADFDYLTTLKSAAPQAVLTFTSPNIAPAPRFVEFRRAAVFNLAAPDNFDSGAFESAIQKNLAAQLTVAAASNADLKWESKNENNAAWRELDFPMLGRSVAYATRGETLILTNDADFLREILQSKTEEKPAKISASPFSELAVVNLEQRTTAFDDVFNRLESKESGSNFFTGNIASLLDSIAEVKRIEIRKNYSSNGFEEELIFALR